LADAVLARIAENGGNVPKDLLDWLGEVPPTPQLKAAEADTSAAAERCHCVRCPAQQVGTLALVDSLSKTTAFGRASALESP